MSTLLNFKNAVLNKCKKRCQCYYCKPMRWLRSSLSSLWSLIKEIINEPELTKSLGLIASVAVLAITGDVKCFLGTIALGLGLINLYEYFRWR